MIYHVYLMFRGNKVNIDSFDHCRTKSQAIRYAKNKYTHFTTLENESGEVVATYTKEEQGK